MDEQRTKIEVDEPTANQQTTSEVESKEYTTRPRPAFGVRAMFGLLIIILYFGMGALCFAGYFFWVNRYISYALGTIFVVYGIWRGYRYLRAQF